MATVTASTALNMATFKIWSGGTYFSSSTKLVYSDGSRIGTFTGTSLSAGTHNLYLGTVTGYSQSLDGFESFDITGLSVNQLTLWNLISTTPKKMFEFMFSKDDDMTGSDGNDYLIGFVGDDVLDGGAGDDKLAGGLGDDTFYVDSVKDIVIEKANEGVDTVISHINYILGKEIENLELMSGMGHNISGTGNKSNNTLTGNESANTLNGKEGDDILTGGAGADTFVFDTKLGAANIDTISDFVSGTDAINLSKKVFSKYKAGADLAADFVSGAGAIAHDASDHILYDTSTGKLYYDADGSDSQAAVLLVTLTGHPKLSASDLYIS